jgi:phage gp36-like protein
MAYLLAGDLDTHIYSDNLNQIVRNDNSIIYTAIDAAIAEAKSYLARYDLLKIFGDDNNDPAYSNEDLKNKVKSLAIWQLVTLGQANIKIELARTRYEDAIRWFEKVAASRINPGFPMPVDDSTTDYKENQTIQWDSEPKRYNHF